MIRDRHANPKTDQSSRDAWEGAIARAGLADKTYTIKDIRAKAMTDAKRAATASTRCRWLVLTQTDQRPKAISNEGGFR